MLQLKLVSSLHNLHSWVEMEIDTGAALLLIRQWQRPDKPKLCHMAQKLVTYTGENITPYGTCEVTLTYDNQKYHLLFVVVEGLGPTLLGRNWLEIIQLSWNSIHQLTLLQLSRSSCRGTRTFSKTSWVN